MDYKICQYCKGPSFGGYTCEVCFTGWPREECRCENNGDYCEACAAWIEARQEAQFAMGRTLHEAE